MSFFRPEAVAVLTKWRAAIIGGSILMVSLWVMSVSVGVLKGISFSFALLGAGLFVDGVIRARFPRDGGGVGVVEVDERQITFLGPHGGGALSIDELIRVVVRTTDDGPFQTDFFWEFTDRAGQRLSIPGNAENASVLFDALTALPGANYEAVIIASGSTEPQSFTVWEAAAGSSH